MQFQQLQSERINKMYSGLKDHYTPLATASESSSFGGKGFETIWV